MEDQVRVLNEQFGEGNWERYDVPSEGWTLQQQKEKVSELLETSEIVVFASPIPAMIKFTVLLRTSDVLIFHNDVREKKELPNGRIIMTVAKEGWVLA